MWPKLFRRMPATRHSNREMEVRAGTVGRERAKDNLHVDRLRELNGFASHERVPKSVPGPDENLRELWRGERDPRRWLAGGGGAARAAPDSAESPAAARRSPIVIYIPVDGEWEPLIRGR